MQSQHIPALSVLVFKGDTILFEATLGHANIEQNIPLAPNQPFLLASISKTVTATALMQLYEAGKFALDDPINADLPFPVHIPDNRQDITFRNLLTHTSAIADGAALDNQYYNGKDSPVALRSFLQDYLTPISMNNTAWHLRDITTRIVQPYNYSRRQFRAIPHYAFTDYPNGGLRSTTRDMHSFLSTFLNGGLLSAATIRQMTTPQIPTIDRDVGFGMFIMNRRLGLWGHNGGEEGASTIMAFNPSTRVGAIILANQGEADLDGLLADAYRFGLGLSGG